MSRLTFNLKVKPMPHQLRGIEFLLKNKHVIFGWQVGCISGEAEIKINRAGCSRVYTLEQLYYKFHGGKSRGRVWDKYIPVKTSSMTKEGDLRLNTISNVWYQGIKEVYEVKIITPKMKVYKLKATNDHLFFTEDKIWTPLENLKTGSKIAVNGKEYCNVCKEYTERVTYTYAANKGKCKPCLYRYQNYKKIKNSFIDKDGYNIIGGVYFHPHAKKSNYRIREHILVYEAYLNGMSYKRYLECLRFNRLEKSFIYICDTGKRIHHINEIKDDNRLENLELISDSEHNVKHKRVANIHKTKVHYGRIISIKKIGTEKVYDITMEDQDNSNFVVNGVVVHNCGKTLGALMAAVLLKKKALVISPAYLRLNWAKEVDKTTNLSSKVFSDSNIKNSNADIVIIGYSQIKYAECLFRERQIIIFDEVHYLKGDSQRTQEAHRLVDRYNPEYLIGLSGTPIKGRVIEWYSLMCLFTYKHKKWFGDIYNYYQFCNKFSNCRVIKVGNRQFRKYQGVKNIPELQKHLLPIYQRVKTEDVLNLPEYTNIDIEVDYKENDTELQEAWDKFQEGRSYSITNKKKSAILKSEFTAKVIQDIVAQGEQVIMFTEHPDVCHKIKRLLPKVSCGIIVGSVSVKQRWKISEEFIAGKIDILLATIGAASSGNTWINCRHTVFNDISFVPGDNDQARGRTRRKGQSRSVFYHYVLGSYIDKRITKEVISKIKDIELAMGGI